MLWLTDRSRQEDGTKDCMRKRWWKYQSYDGYGVALKAARVERSVGIAVHGALARVLDLVRVMGSGAAGALVPGDIFGRGGLYPPRDLAEQEKQARVQARAGVDEATAWLLSVAAAGFDKVPADQQAHILAEQSALVEGMAWGWLRGQFPEVVRRFEILDVEREESYVVGCTCRLASTGGGLADHDAAGCEGVGHQARPDWVAKDRATGEVGIHDFKTSKSLGDYDVDQYRLSIQMAANTLAVEARMGVPVTHYYIHSLLKGQNKPSYEPTTREFTGPRRQNSPWCYTEYLPPAPPMRKSDEVADQLQWYKRTPVWEVKWAHKPEGWGVGEYLAQVMPLPKLQQQFTMVGPFPRQGFLTRRYMRQMGIEEKRWLDRVWEVHDRVAAGEDLEDALDAVVPQSWGCFKYGAESGACEFLGLCAGDGTSSPQDPLASGEYVLRTPHHDYERERAEGARAPKESARAEEGK